MVKFKGGIIRPSNSTIGGNYYYDEHVDFTSIDVPVTDNPTQDVALDILTAVLYRMYTESVDDHGRHIDHAA